MNHDPLPERLIVEDQIQCKRIIASANESHLASSLALKMKLLASKVQSIKKRDKRSNEAAAVFCKCRLLETDKLACCDTCNHICVVVTPQILTRNTQCA